MYKIIEFRLFYSEWIDSFKDYNIKRRIDKKVRELCLGKFGNCKQIDRGLSELKLDIGPGYRVYFGIKNKDIIILLMAGDKSTQVRDIEKAKELWKECKEKNYE